MWITISAGRSFALGAGGMSVSVVLALRGVGREVNGEGRLMFCSREKERERVVEDNESRGGIGEEDVVDMSGAGDGDGMGVDVDVVDVVDGGEGIVGRALGTSGFGELRFLVICGM